MTCKKQLDLGRIKAEQQRKVALQTWKQTHPHTASSDSHQAAFLAGYDSVAGPMPPTGDEFIAKIAQQINSEAEQKRQRIAAMPDGTCPECEGEGELVSAMHCTKCTHCNGTGRIEGGAA